jgi:hypothetical protein
MSDAMRHQPVMQHHQVRGRRTKAADLLLQLAPFPNHYASHYRLFVDIQTRTPAIYDFHYALLSQLSPEDAFLLKILPGVFSICGETTVSGALRRPGQIVYGLEGTNVKPTFCHRDNLPKDNTRFSSFVGGATHHG